MHKDEEYGLVLVGGKDEDIDGHKVKYNRADK